MNNEATATWRGGHIVLDCPVDWPEGTRLVVLPQTPVDAASAEYRQPEFTERLMEHTARAKTKAIDENVAAGLGQTGAK